jgi:serine/threonine protein phosphatase PrpC
LWSHLFAVVDGFGSMGLGGDVASATVIDILKRLDTQHSVGELATSLESLLADANDKLKQLCDEHSSAAGVTCTAMLWSGRHMALAHVGNTLLITRYA